MVVVEGGFRDRWHRQVLSRQHGTAGNQCEDSQQDLFGLQRDEFSDVADDSFLHVHGFAGSDAEGSLDLPLDPEQNLEQGSTLSEGSQKRFLEPRPKSRPQSLVSGVTRSLGVKRTADEFASMKVLTVSEVQQLESICLQDELLHHRVIAGHFLFCLMAAARWHDSMHVVSMELSKADHLCLLEAATSKHKSSRTKEQQRELLPFTALGQTLAGENWADSWLSAREDSGSFAWCHFLCSWSEHQGDWADTKMSTAEATFWLRELLEPVVGPDRSAVLTVHGLKATMLSWAAKSMLFTPEEQLALGHHVSSHYKSALIYSRDDQIGLCKKIHDMMDKIKAGTFNPDGSRVQRLLQLTMARAQELQSDDDSDTSSTSTDASSVASSEGEHREQEPSSFRRLDAADIDRDHCFINTRSRVVHLQLLGQQKFWCGRCASSSFRKASMDDLANAAFLRRNLAYDLAGIGTFSVMDLWTQKLFEKMNEAPLANYRSISAEQILSADKALWVKLSNETRGQLQPKTGDPKAFDEQLNFTPTHFVEDAVFTLQPVTLANQLYRAAIVILQLCFALGCLVSIENPGRSWLWPLLALLVHAEYPPLLCNRMAECVRKSAEQMGVFPSLQPRLKELLNLSLGHQTLRHEPLIPEYATVFHTDAPIQHESHKLLSAPFSQGHHSTEQPEETQAPQEHEPKRPRKEFKYGVWHTPEQFLTRAEAVAHPMDDESFLHVATKDAIKKVVGTDLLILATERLATVFNLRKLTNELKCQELALKDTMHPDVKRCTVTKNILLFEHVLKQLDFWDLEVVSLLKQGIPLVGLQAAPKGYREQLVPASITEDELLQSSAWRRKSLMCQSKRFKPEEEAAPLKTTAEEVAKGFLEGPYSEQEISVLLETEDWSLSPRFVLFQGTGGKIRVIDDAKKSAVNAAYSSTVKLQLQDVDYAANMVLFLMSEAAAAGVSGDEWMGKTFDLSKAYKQLAILPAHQQHAVVGFPVSGTWRFYRSISLPFGCTGSVYGFVRVSQAIWYIVTKLLSAISSHYFDDFPTLERAPGCRVLSLAFSAVLDMLGWEHAKEGDKALNFAGAFDLLGVNFNLALTPKGILQ
ncbi:unnamed protein product, partial [Cladocopium goreaui]